MKPLEVLRWSTGLVFLAGAADLLGGLMLFKKMLGTRVTSSPGLESEMLLKPQEEPGCLYWLHLLTSFRCDDSESGCERAWAGILEQRTAAVASRSSEMYAETFRHDFKAAQKGAQ